MVSNRDVQDWRMAEFANGMDEAYRIHKLRSAGLNSPLRKYYDRQERPMRIIASIEFREGYNFQTRSLQEHSSIVYEE